MQLSPAQSIKLGLVKSYSGCTLLDSDYLGKSSIDLKVRTIISRSEDGKKEETSSYQIAPQEMVCLISSERIDVKPGYVAYVFLKNQLSQKGLLALNTGIVDSGFCGPLSTLVTNLSSEYLSLDSNSELQDENIFLRVVFHRLGDFNGDNSAAVKTRYYDYYTYARYKKDEISRLPKYFLNRKMLQDDIAKQVSSKAAEIKLSKTSLIVVIFLTLVTIFLPMVYNKLGSLISEEQKVLKLQIEVLEKRIKQLEEK
ncbi:hypothetical protein CXF76_13510 [Pseudoalteromonas sp. 78C3]|uniref:dCTP deaminase domain-containing protein n=1 Tax=Pseudoalteromonas sp. 78C3 TaxID=2058300 RepID=UPI000C349361|nr:hypothetical protein [Pseudoalteromonas sp. 78C3]PKH91059.1 hypothetical protein CXF76_13510 [Pseudoalteromonas sp. 78C3]